MTTYSEAGVDIDLADKAKAKIKQYVKETYTKDSVLDAGFFCGGIRLDLKQYKEPVLMLGNDGVGTKMVIARMMNKYDTVGIDLVNHCANDVLASGAKPLFFLDYIASEKIVPEVAAGIVKGIAAACKKLGVVLVGGETAQMPGVYVKGETDLAGTMGGMVDRHEIIDGREISEGDVLIGIASTGLHTNGYSLARKILLDDCSYKVNDFIKELDSRLGDALLAPHREYVTTVFQLKAHIAIKGIAHITGGGMTDNLPRILPNGLGARISLGTWEMLPIFRLLQEKGNVPEAEMLHTFNMGVGLIIAVDRKEAARALVRLRQEKEKAWIIGEVVKGAGVKYVQG